MSLEKTNYSLPQAYIEQMKQMLPKDGDAFLQSYTEPRTFGLRANPVKWLTHPDARSRSEKLFQLRPVPWCEEGYYYEESSRPGKHPYHAAGFYYIQEPSAMSAVSLLDPQPGEFILDLAAAPGGKSTHIAGRMRGEGVLISNEIHPQRAKILAENIERMGIPNTIVTQSDPHALAAKFPQAFDRIMLDAPCSGEGMFRKDNDAIKEWSPEHVAMCAARQWDIIQAAVTMLKPGGTIAYSTCTFNHQENEGIIEKWLQHYDQFKLIRMERIWPHHSEGEGHFVAVLQLQEGDSESIASTSSTSRRGKTARKGRGTRSNEAQTAFTQFEAWMKEFLPGIHLPQGMPLLFGEELYWLPQGNESAVQALRSGETLQGLRIPRAGLHLAHIRKNRIEPAHALAMFCSSSKVAAQSISYDVEDPAAEAYLRGEALLLEGENANLKGWTLVAIDGLPIGFGKASGGQLKNHYPKGLRK
ncbi:RsmB/NOP family class I SAM-dependent RNA methyltransferase [Paenibacillus sp. MER 180]|uniref:RsmB/NOP family class I SAM-dependent RNA methyltransferase n=1 Tax=Paenibacillus sp. MER 180 TaxID=2939570 RepID=UPI002041C9F1|nr:RsmB/NOP family class I SAM-dependent RNA methyltransferase [Paenibacillus sp. MER 180]MCM3291443.1 RsmB/NOP family class I SAM-dependent RNA methyltransferase [Paenibacillus sp. MER 180]